MKPPAQSATEVDPPRARRAPIAERVDLPGGWVSEGAMPLTPHPAVPDGLASFPSELDLLPPVATSIRRERSLGVSPVVEPSEAERLRAFPPAARMHVPLKRLSGIASVAIGALVAGALGAVVVVGALFLRSTDASGPVTRTATATAPATPAPEDPATTTAQAATGADVARTPLFPTPVVTPKPTPTTAPPIAARSHAQVPQKNPWVVRRTTSVNRSSDGAATAAPAARPPALPAATLPNPTSWQLSSSVATVSSTPPFAPPPDRARTPAPTPIPTPASGGSTAVSTPNPAPIVTPAAPTATPTVTLTPAASPTVAPSEASARVARTASVQSVLDRYRNAYDALDAAAVKSFWPDADVRALNRAFAQLDSQRFQFDHCDIELAGSRAFASCRGYAQFVKKAGAREMRLEPRRWSFTLGEVSSGWVILSVEARAGQ